MEVGGWTDGRAGERASERASSGRASGPVSGWVKQSGGIAKGPTDELVGGRVLTRCR